MARHCEIRLFVYRNTCFCRVWTKAFLEIIASLRVGAAHFRGRNRLFDYGGILDCVARVPCDVCPRCVQPLECCRVRFGLRTFSEPNVGTKPPTVRFEMEAMLAEARSTLALLQDHLERNSLHSVNKPMTRFTLKTLCLSLVVLMIEARLGRAQEFETMTNSLQMTLVRVLGGEFSFGPHDSPKDREVIDGFTVKMRMDTGLWMQQHEVSADTYHRFCKEAEYVTSYERNLRRDRISNPEIADQREPITEKTSVYPVNYVALEDCVQFCKWLSKLEGREYRLPTEAEWEYCCLLGCNGVEKPSLFESPVSWVGKHQLGDEQSDKLPLGEFRTGPRATTEGAPDLLGLYNMRGNVQELCDSWYHARMTLQLPSGVVGRVVPVVVRGGSWTQGPMWAQAKKRSWQNAYASTKSTGFRVVLDLRKKQ